MIIISTRKYSKYHLIFARIFRYDLFEKEIFMKCSLTGSSVIKHAYFKLNVYSYRTSWRHCDFRFGEEPLIWPIGHVITGRSFGGYHTSKISTNVHSWLQQSEGLRHSSAFVNGAMHFIATTRLWRHQALRWWNLALFQARRGDIPLRKWRHVQGRMEV